MNTNITFGESSRGTQVGINHGQVTVNHNSNLENVLPTVHEAAFNSYHNQHEDECLEGTRTQLLREIKEWAFSPQSKCIFWLNGLAGTGKSTISRTVAREFKSINALGASFFFKRGESDRGNATKLFTTIASQFATSLPAIRPYIENAIQKDPSVVRNGLRDQFEKLLLGPFTCLNPNDFAAHPMMLIVIDALDECEGDRDVTLLLQILPDLQRLTPLRLQIFVTSRPELPIQLDITKIDHDEIALHEIAPNVIRDDISLFLHDRMRSIRERHHFPNDWPGDVRLQKLVDLSVPLFIFAATICRLLDGDLWDPEDSLTEILDQRGYTKLDATYLPILNRVLGGLSSIPSGQIENRKKQLIQEFGEVVGTIVVLETPLSIAALSQLLDVPKRIVRLRVNLVRSCLNIPNNEDIPVRLYHLSFRDFLLDSQNQEKTDLWVDESATHHRLAIRCLLTCQRRLKKNIAGLNNDSVGHSNISQDFVQMQIPPELQYACRYWAYHLVQYGDGEELLDKELLDMAFSFLQEHLLHWVEAMSLLHLTSEVIDIVQVLERAAEAMRHKEASEFLHDTRRFMLKNHQMIDFAPLQLYSSGIMFLPRNSQIRQIFSNEFPSEGFRLISELESHWGPELQVLEGHTDVVKSVTFSPDQTLLASGSRDGLIRIWDSGTGRLQQTLQTQPGRICFLAFAPNSQLLASLSDGPSELRIWNIATGALHSRVNVKKGLRSLQFSPDGQLIYLVYGYPQLKNIVLWDITAETIHRYIRLRGLPGSDSDSDSLSRYSEAHAADGLSGSYKVGSWAFSPNCQLIATINAGKVSLWNARTGIYLKMLLEAFEAPLAFTPDSQSLVIGSSGKLYLWDTERLQLKKTLAAMPNESTGIRGISSLATSSDGMIALGGRDGEIELYSMDKGTSKGTLRGHTGSIESLAFSANGKILISGSHDKTIVVWESNCIHSGSSLVISPSQSSRSVRWMRFLHSGLLASHSGTPGYFNSFSAAHTTRRFLWDPMTGALIRILKPTFSGSQSPEQLAFSADGLLLAWAQGNDIRVQNVTDDSLFDCLLGKESENFSFQYSNSHDSPDSSPEASAFSLDGQLLAVRYHPGCGSLKILVWGLATGSVRFRLEDSSHSDHCTFASRTEAELLEWSDLLSFSSDGHFLASVCRCYPDKVLVWELETGTLKRALECSGSVSSVTFSPDGQLLAAVVVFRTVHIWDLETRFIKRSLSAEKDVRSVRFSQDHSYLYTNWGRLYIEATNTRPGFEYFASSESAIDLSFSGDNDQWLVVNGKGFLWLPKNLRPSYSAVHDNKIALGLHTGQVMFLEYTL